MDYRALGRTGLTVSALGFGCGAVGGLLVRGGEEEQRRVVARALDAGVTYFDTAPGYGDGRSEENLGRVLTELRAWDRVAVGTKVRLAADDLKDPPAAVRRSLTESLRRLGRAHVDLLQLHNSIGGPSGVSPAEMTGGIAAALHSAVEAGLARHAGFTGIGHPPALHAAVASGGFETVQCYFSALNPSAGFAGAAGGSVNFGGLIDAAANAGMGVINIRVLAAGAVTGSADRAPNASPAGGGLVAGSDFDADLARAQMLLPLVRELGLEGPAELSFRFALAKPGISTVLVGFSGMDQLESALRWTERGPLGVDAVAKVVALARAGKTN